MSKKFLSMAFIIATALSVSLFVQTMNASQVTADVILTFDQICPTEITKGEIVTFGGTVLNNYSLNQELVFFRVDINNNLKGIEASNVSYSLDFPDNDERYVLEVQESRSIFFEKKVENNDLRVGSNYTARLIVGHKDVGSGGEIPRETQIGENVTLAVVPPEYTPPNYIWAVLVVLSLGVLSFVVLGIVGWIRDRRGKK